MHIATSITAKILKNLFPIKTSELPKFIPMALLMFLILLNYNLVRSIKDSLIVTVLGAEVISFCKLWFEMPCGVLFVFLYTYMCNRMSTERAFRYVMSAFLIFFGAFAFILFPYREYFHPSVEIINRYLELYPHLHWFVIIWSKWSFIVFYVAGELWPIIVFNLLFWQLANKTTSTEEASRFYTFFSFFGQSNLLVSGSIIIYFSSKTHFLTSFFYNISDTTEIMIKSMCMVVLISGAMCLFLHKLIEVTVVKKMQLIKREHLHLGLRESLAIISKSKYLLHISILIISYSTAVILIEGLWFSKVKELYNSTESFARYQGNVLFWTGVGTLLCSIIGSTLIKFFGWYRTAMIIPIMTLVAGLLFFGFVIAQPYLNFLHFTPLFIIVFIGGLQNVLCKSVKYSLFDATKEMVYIPLDDELKTKGKAAVDVIGMKIGKSSGAIVQFLILMIWPGSRLNDMASVLLTIFCGVCVVWCYGVKALSKEYNTLLKGKKV